MVFCRTISRRLLAFRPALAVVDLQHLIRTRLWLLPGCKYSGVTGEFTSLYFLLPQVGMLGRDKRWCLGVEKGVRGIR